MPRSLLTRVESISVEVYHEADTPMTRFLQPGFFRIALATAVVLSHLSNFEIGRPAVFAFFALSGFWVMRMYDEKYSKSGGAGVFFVSRWLRIWLPFAAAYLGFLIIQSAAFGNGDPGALRSLGILGIATTGIDVLGVSWSLDIELQFYLMVPMLWSAIRLIDARGHRPGPILAAASLPLTLIGWWLGLGYGVWTLLAYLPGFLAGLLIWHSGWRPNLRDALASAGMFVAAGVLVWLLPLTRAFLEKDTPTILHEDWFGMAWIALLVPFIAYNVRQRSDWLDQHLGNYSYALYITHWPVIWIVRHLIDASPAVEKLVALAAVGLVSLTFYLLVDRTAERLRQAYLGLRLPSAASRRSITT
ncbi:MAG: acyltransferase [Hyphomicrobiaceae bacterium]